MQSPPPPIIYIIGAQSTGKSTLVDALEAHFRQDSSSSSLPKPIVIREVARAVLREHHYTAQDIRDSPTRALELQRLILAAQADAERKAAIVSDSTKSHPWLISDRSAIDPVVYAWQYVGPEAARALIGSANWQDMRDRMAASLVVVCEAGVDWLTDDGVRLMPTGRDEWAKTHEVFCQVLEEAQVRYVVLPCGLGRTEERVEFVLREFGTARCMVGKDAASLSQ
ncbi:hypothetical protein PG985_013064 [Apiospora marii]|uniref:NadR/Ttd14 AAA domain-containing protein n=1 Tax=Apiospora marii TaxID=335849 RepID=A0ABR1RBM8_9PEZI